MMFFLSFQFLTHTCGLTIICIKSFVHFFVFYTAILFLLHSSIDYACTFRVPSMHLPCIFHASRMHLPCNFRSHVVPADLWSSFHFLIPWIIPNHQDFCFTLKSQCSLSAGDDSEWTCIIHCSSVHGACIIHDESECGGMRCSFMVGLFIVSCAGHRLSTTIHQQPTSSRSPS